jgi:flagellar hook-associated protein 1 FlgK
MPWVFSTIETGRRALFVIQRMMDTASHNIANATTPGYSRQRVNVKATDPYTLPSSHIELGAMQVGTGSMVESILRQRNVYLDRQMRDSTGSGAYFEQLQTMVAQAETIFNEPSSGAISGALTDFWNAWQDVGTNPESMSMRGVLGIQTEALCAKIRDAYNQLTKLSEDSNYWIATHTEAVNTIAGQIADLNSQIMEVKGMGFEPNDLLDRRDYLLDQLAELTNYNVAEGEEGGVTVSIGDFVLVQDSFTQTLVDTSDITGGKIGALRASQTKVGGYVQMLDDLAAGLIAQVNVVHQMGFDLDGNAGIEFFTGTGAADIELNPLIADDLRLVAAASIPAAGNGENATAIADLRRALTMSGGTQTFAEFYEDLVTTVGSETKRAADSAETQSSVTLELQNQRDAVSGVSLDEELMNMMMFQRSYEAAARVVKVADEMIDTLLTTLS